MFLTGLPLTVPDQARDAVRDQDRHDSRPRTATQLYREVDRMMTTLVRTGELRSQQEG